MLSAMLSAMISVDMLRITLLDIGGLSVVMILGDVILSVLEQKYQFGRNCSFCSNVEAGNPY
jgi:hypothetical protein